MNKQIRLEHYENANVQGKNIVDKCDNNNKAKKATVLNKAIYEPNF